MKKYIQKFLSKKRNIAALIVLFLIGFVLLAYTIQGINRSLEKMAEEQEDVLYFPDYPIPNTTGKDPALIKRGEYLVKAGDCIACHTNSLEKGVPFAGGLPMATPFGTIYAPNITPDKETGIGRFSEEDFIKAMREGISPEGHYYYPAFPYLYFANVTVDDLKAMKAYLDSIPPVRQVNRQNEMVWPFNQRLLQLPWRLLFFHPNKPAAADLQFSTQPQTTDLLKRGAYLVEGLGHCAMCHSPSYHIFSEKLSLGAPIRKYDLTGAKIAGYLAPDISKWNLEHASIEEIIEVFTKDKLIGGGKVEGPMLEVNHDSLRYLERSDLLAIATYLKSVQSQKPPKPTGSQAGKAIYDMYCSGCHATGAGGAPTFGDATSWEVLLKKGAPQIYTNALKGIGGMPAKGTCLSCSDDDIKKAVDYMLAAAKSGGAKAKMTPVPKLTAADGMRIYQANCSACHAAGLQGAPKLGDKLQWTPILKKGFIQIYTDVVTGNEGHPSQGACVSCNDAEIKAAIKYMLNESGSNENYMLW